MTPSDRRRRLSASGSRRRFLATSARLGGLLALGALPWSRLGASPLVGGARLRRDPRPDFDEDPFSLGIASGDPHSDGVVLWTRLLPTPDPDIGLAAGPAGAGVIPVGWEVAADPEFARIVRSGTASAFPQLAHSVHVEVEGLEPARDYWYRFHLGDAVSPTGRTRTAPAPDADPDRVRFAFASCQHYERGWYTTLRHLSEEEIDVVLHLGDYIYEEGPGTRTDLVRLHDAPEPVTLEGYRGRYALYKRDPDLQAAHAAFPWVVTPDDHEVANDYAGDRDDVGTPPEAFLARRAAAYQAFYEHMPLRRDVMPVGPDMPVHRRLDYGSLLRFHVLDERQYRTDQPCGGKRERWCAEAASSSATMLGDAQERWLFEGLDRSPARWNALASQVMIAQLRSARDGVDYYGMDKWDGYQAARARLLGFLERRRPSNPVVVTGDIHTNWVADLKPDFDDPSSPVVAAELVGTSLSSSGDGADMTPVGRRYLDWNPHVKFYNAQRGYVRCEVTRERLRADYRVVPYVTRPDAPISTHATFVVEDGVPGANEA